MLSLSNKLLPSLCYVLFIHSCSIIDVNKSNRRRSALSLSNMFKQKQSTNTNEFGSLMLWVDSFAIKPLSIFLNAGRLLHMLKLCL